MSRHELAFTRAYRVAALPFGVMPATTYVDLGPEGLAVRFGWWRLRTDLANVVSAEVVDGPFAFVKTAGPPHLSFADRGVTFATNAGPAVCVRFDRPVPGIDPSRTIRHPGATITVRHPASFVTELDALRTELAGRARVGT